MRQEYLCTNTKLQSTNIQAEGGEGSKRMTSPCLLMVTYSIILWTMMTEYTQLLSQRIRHLPSTYRINFFSFFVELMWWLLRLQPRIGYLITHTHTSFVPYSNFWNRKEEEEDCVVEAPFGELYLETLLESFSSYCSASRSFLSDLYLQTAPTWQLRQHNK